MPSERTNNVPRKGSRPGSRDPYIFWHTIKNIFKNVLAIQLWSVALHMECPTGSIKNFPQKRRGTGHVTPTIFGIRSNISSKLLELGTSSLVHRFALKIFPRRACRRSGDLKIFRQTIGLIKFANKTANIKYEKLISLQHRVRAMKSHTQNSTNHFSGIMW